MGFPLAAPLVIRSREQGAAGPYTAPTAPSVASASGDRHSSHYELFCQSKWRISYHPIGSRSLPGSFSISCKASGGMTQQFF